MGVGLGGFIDGILFHQILQTHGMLTARYPKTSFVNYQVNMTWDGIFHIVTWTMVVIGVATLWRIGKRNDVPWSGRTYFGAMVLGWGLFNTVEGVIDHHILHLHHVVESMGVSVWDYTFVGSGLAMIAAGWVLIASARDDRVPRGQVGPATTTP